MSLTPETTTPVATGRGRLRRRVWTGLFAIFAFEIGAFLLVFPWMDSWTLNHLPSFFPSLPDFQDLWDDPYFKGAVSGLGLANLYIAFGQLIHLIRSSRKHA
jgi:hypothetical protein